MEVDIVLCLFPCSHAATATQHDDRKMMASSETRTATALRQISTLSGNDKWSPSSRGFLISPHSFHFFGSEHPDHTSGQSALHNIDSKSTSKATLGRPSTSRPTLSTVSMMTANAAPPITEKVERGETINAVDEHKVSCPATSTDLGRC